MGTEWKKGIGIVFLVIRIVILKESSLKGLWGRG